MNAEEQLAMEKPVLTAVLTHVMHRLNEFFDEGPPDRFKGHEPRAIAEEFLRWLAKKDNP
jgi:hypothetical protein